MCVCVVLFRLIYKILLFHVILYLCVFIAILFVVGFCVFFFGFKRGEELLVSGKRR